MEESGIPNKNRLYLFPYPFYKDHWKFYELQFLPIDLMSSITGFLVFHKERLCQLESLSKGGTLPVYLRLPGEKSIAISLVSLYCCSTCYNLWNLKSRYSLE